MSSSFENLREIETQNNRVESSIHLLGQNEMEKFKNTALALSSNGSRLPDAFPVFNLDIVQSATEASSELAFLVPASLSSWLNSDKTNSKRERSVEGDPAKALYGKYANALDAISADACVQPYGIGNCYFVAAMASYAKVNPQGIIDMISDNKDGSYTVKFPGLGKSLTVDKPTDAELEQVGGLTKYGVWPVVLMKAYGKYCGNSEEKMEGADGGSILSAGVKIFSRQGVSYLGVGYMLPLMSWKSMDAELQQALNPKERKDALPVTASTSKSLLSDSTSDGFVRGHVYSVLAYEHNNRDVKQSKVTLRNPHGGAEAVKTISLEKFYANFLQLSIPKR